MKSTLITNDNMMMKTAILHRKAYYSQGALDPKWQKDRLKACRGFELGVIHWDSANRVIRAAESDASVSISRKPIPLSILGEVETRYLNGKLWEVTRNIDLKRLFKLAREDATDLFIFCRDHSLVYLDTGGPVSWRDNYDKIQINNNGKIEVEADANPAAVKLFAQNLATLLRRGFDLRVYQLETEQEVMLGRPVIGTEEIETVFTPRVERQSRSCVQYFDSDYDPQGYIVGSASGRAISLSANDDLTPSLANAVKPVPPKTPQRTKNRLALLKKALSSNFSHNLRGVLVFGSTARGQARPDSDLDIMLVCQTTNRHEEENFLSALRSQPDCPEIPLPPTPIIIDEPNIFAREVSLKFIPFHLLERIGIKVSGAGLDPSKAFIEDYVVVARTPQEAEQIRAKIESKKAEILKLIQKGSAS